MNQLGTQSEAVEAADDAREVLALVGRARSRDLDAYNELVRRYQRRVYALVYNMTSSREDSEDLVQDVFFKAYHALPTFKGDAQFYTWIHRIAINRTLNFLKKRKRISTGKMSLDDMDSSIERDPDYVQLSSRSSPVRDLALNELQEKLNAAIQQLSDQHRAVVVLHDIQGLQHEEIGKLLGASTGTIRSRLFYARKQLQEILAEFAP